MKRCPRCGQERPVSEYGLNRARVDGLAAYCKPCARSYRNEYGLQHRAHLNERNRLWREANPEKMAKLRQAWLVRHPEYPSEKEHRRRARKYATDYEKVDRVAIYERDEGICQLCETPVDAESFTLDHAIPIAHGGPHRAWNVRIAHRECNNRRGTRPHPMKLRVVPVNENGHLVAVPFGSGALPCVVIRGDWAVVDIRRKAR